MSDQITLTITDVELTPMYEIGENQFGLKLSTGHTFVRAGSPTWMQLLREMKTLRSTFEADGRRVTFLRMSPSCDEITLIGDREPLTNEKLAGMGLLPVRYATQDGEFRKLVLEEKQVEAAKRFMAITGCNLQTAKIAVITVARKMVSYVEGGREEDEDDE